MKEIVSMQHTLFFDANTAVFISLFKTPEQYQEAQLWHQVVHWVSKEAGSPDFLLNNSS